MNEEGAYYNSKDLKAIYMKVSTQREGVVLLENKTKELEKKGKLIIESEIRQMIASYDLQIAILYIDKKKLLRIL